MRLLEGDRGRISAQQILENINPHESIHQPYTSLVSIENTCNKGGGSYYTFQQMKEISETSRSNNLKVHLDGARIFNAITETGDSPVEIGKLFDTISICLSKGLGAPVGSLVLTSKENMIQAKRIRKGFGGGMRQSGYLAAAGIYALDHHIERLKEDHKRAKEIFHCLKSLLYIAEVLPVETNIVVFRLVDEKPVEHFLNYLSAHSIKAIPFGKQVVRMVTHLDFNDDMLQIVLAALKKY
jgi:threonine aldolase